jgi:FAD synthase
MEISFIKRIRDEKRFRNLKELSKQLRVDKIETLKIIENEEVRN